jgi:glycosyltransferase involved in cell wall biosynthesis
MGRPVMLTNMDEVALPGAPTQALASTAAVAPDAPVADLAVDIIINNYDYGRFLGQAIESALAQTHAQVQVIVVDDGSTDDSRAILRAYEDRIDLVLKENGGQASALNAGFARSQGDIVIFLDADDTLRPSAASLAAAAFAADPEVVKVQYRMEVIDANGRPSGVIKPPDHLPLPAGDVRKAELTFPFDLAWLATSGNAFRTDALRRILPIPERDFALCADYYLVHLTTLLGSVVSLEDVAGCYRVHGDNRFERQTPTLDLEHVRQTVTYSVLTTRQLERLAAELGLKLPYGHILSVSALSNRLVSLKVDPELHPIQGDRAWLLMLDGVRAAMRRFDVAWPMKLLYIAWFVTTALAPRPLAKRLGEYLIFPQRREGLNRALGVLNKWNRTPPEQANVGAGRQSGRTREAA